MTDFFIDIGNTRIKYAANQKPFQLRYSEHAKLAPIFAAITEKKPQSILITAGRSESAQLARSNLIAHAEAHQITTKNVIVCPELLALNYKDHTQFGADRFLNLLAARKRYQTSFCVVSAGTAITLDFYTTQHIGGMILLGLGSMKSMLVAKTGLPDIAKPKQLLGNDTASSIGAGIYLGLQNLIECSIARVSQAENMTFHTVWTGGDAEALYSHGDIVPDLLFEGMAYYDKQITL